MRTFEVFVIIGVAGELLADGGIFLFSKHLQAIAELEIATLTRETGDAKTSAENASAAASRATSSERAKAQLASCPSVLAVPMRL
jgi:hypothetical protein